MNARISQLHATEAEWSKFNQWIPKAGELVVYDPDEVCSYTRLKIGDGVHTLNRLSFIVDAVISQQLCQIDGGRITEYSNKIK